MLPIAGTTIELSAVPDSTTASARPRDFSNRLDTAAAQTVGEMKTALLETISQAAHQDQILALTSDSEAKVHRCRIAPVRPIRRGPQRSIAMPTNGLSSTPTMPRIIIPEEICARLQPNSASSGKMNTPIE